MTTIVIKPRFCGPKTSGNGGYSAGLFASMIDGAAEVTLRAPPPLDAPILLAPRDDADGDGYEARHGKHAIATIKPATVDCEAPPMPGVAEVNAAREAFLSDCNGEHVIPHCFVCGNKRKEGDGLCIFSGPVPDSAMNADFWRPGEGLADDAGLVKPEFLWAALDCPGGLALRLWPSITLLGQFSVDIMRRPKFNETLVAAGWPRGADGRKHYSSSALYDEEGAVIACANATWIELNDPAMLAKLAAER